MTTTTVTRNGCGASLQRKGSEVRRNQSGHYYCPNCTLARNHANGTMPQQRGWRRGAAA